MNMVGFGIGMAASAGPRRASQVSSEESEASWLVIMQHKGFFDDANESDSASDCETYPPLAEISGTLTDARDEHAVLTSKNKLLACCAVAMAAENGVCAATLAAHIVAMLVAAPRH